MPIEEAFRALKNSRFGWSLESSRTAQLERLPLLLLIGALAMRALWLLGKAVEFSGRYRYYPILTRLFHIATTQT